MKIEEIRQQCASLSNEELLLVVNNKRLYTEQIVKIAYQEINKRKLPKQEVKEIEKAQARRSKVLTGDFLTDLLLFEKIGFFFMFLPNIHRFVLWDYRKKGYLLKVRQAYYFIVSGAAFFLLGLLLFSLHVRLLVCFVFWVLGFVAAFILNQSYFKERIIRWLKSRTNNEGPSQPVERFYP